MLHHTTLYFRFLRDFLFTIAFIHCSNAGFINYVLFWREKCSPQIFGCIQCVGNHWCWSGVECVSLSTNMHNAWIILSHMCRWSSLERKMIANFIHASCYLGKQETTFQIQIFMRLVWADRAYKSQRIYNLKNWS